MRSALVAVWLIVVARADAAPKGPLLVEANPPRAAVHAGEAFPVAVTMVNPGQTTESVAIWLCSWPEQWQTDDPQVSVEGAECSKNFPTTVDIAAHGRDTRSLVVTLAAGAKPGPHAFRLGFTPIAGSVTWTSTVTVTAIATSTGMKITGKPSASGIAFALSNPGAKPIELDEHLQLQRLFDGAWVDLSEMSGSACAAPQPTCVTLAARASLARPWEGMVCAQCNCDRNGRAQPGEYRLIAHACGGATDFIGAGVALAK